MIKLQQLSKQYSTTTWGLRDFSLEIKPGILGLIGPNGAGKSTLMRILATVTRPTAGTAFWNGTDILAHPDDLRRQLGFLPQDFGVFPNLNAIEFLTYIAALKGIDVRSARQRIDDLLQMLNLHAARKRRLGGYSGGMKQRIGIAQAMLNDPKLLIVDEPTVGLDPEERVRFRNLLGELSGDRIVILSTHIVSDVESTADQIAVISAGRLIEQSTPERLLALATGSVWEWLVSPERSAEVRKNHQVSSAQRRPDGTLLRIIHESSPHPEAVAVAPNLEDAYLFTIARSRAAQAA